MTANVGPELTPGLSSATARTGAPRSKLAATSHVNMSHASSRATNRTSSADPLSDRATEALIRRVLLPQHSGDKTREPYVAIHELLPPLTSSNDVDFQLYAFLAIILKEFVQNWYNKITPDEAFVAEVVHVIAHCTRALEQRLRMVDLEALLFNEVPEILDRHVSTYRCSHQRQASTHAVTVRPRDAYHSLWPIPYMTPVPDSQSDAKCAEQLHNEAAYRQLLVHAVLTILLPTEDLENSCLTALVGQIFSELIIGNIVAKKAAQPWLLYEAICIGCRVIREKNGGPEKRSTKTKSGLHLPRKKSLHKAFISFLQFVFLALSWMRLLFSMITMSTTLPPRSAPLNEHNPPMSGKSDHHDHDSSKASHKLPILKFKAWSCLGNVMQLKSRMPWLNGLLSLLQFCAVDGPGRIARLDGGIDRLLTSRIQLLLSASHLPPILRSVRSAVFPNNAPGSTTLFPPTSDEELRALRRRTAASISTLVPTVLGRIYFGCGALPLRKAEAPTDDEVIEQLEGILDILSDEYCNKHLLYSVLELILVRLMPELAEKGVAELEEERLG